MSDSWPGQWHSKVPDDGSELVGEKSRPSITNDHGMLLLFDTGPEEYLWMEGEIPTNHC